MLCWCASGPVCRRTPGSASPVLQAMGGRQLMPDVIGCLWSGVTYAGVWAGPTDLPPEAICVLRSVPPLVQEATHEPVQRVSTGCRPGAARSCRLASAHTRSCRVVGGLVLGGGGQESSPPSTVLLPACCGCLWAGCCPQGLTLPPLALRAGPVTHSFRFTGTPR